jgi:hypothetical protein
LFGFATLLHIAKGINIDENIFSQDDVTKFRQGLFTLLGSDITPDPKKLLSPNFVTLFFPLLDGKGNTDGYDSHIQFHLNSQNALLVLGYCSAPSTPEKQSTKPSNVAKITEYDFIFSENFENFDSNVNSKEEVSYNSKEEVTDNNKDNFDVKDDQHFDNVDVINDQHLDHDMDHNVDASVSSSLSEEEEKEDEDKDDVYELQFMYPEVPRVGSGT